MRNYAPLLPYVSSLWLGLTWGLGDINIWWVIFIIWCGLGCWLGFQWSLKFTVLRLTFTVACLMLGWTRSRIEVQSRMFPKDSYQTFTIKACSTHPVSHGKTIYGYGKTLEAGKVAFQWPSDFIYPSNWMTVIGKWNRFPEAKANTSFNVKEYYESLGCMGVFIPVTILSKTSQNSFPFEYRTFIKSKFEAAEVSSPSAGLLLGLSTGDKSWLDRSTRALFARAGLAHLLAVSGYHVGLVGCIPLLFMRSKRREIRWLSLIGIISIWCFIVACGTPWSAVRSGIMVTVGCFSKWFGRSVLPWQGWAIAAWIVAWIDPWAPQQLGTQLSFAATAGILAIVSSPKWLLIRIPIAAQTATMAWAATTFNQLPIWFLPINIIASPIIVIVGVFLGSGIISAEMFPELGAQLIVIAGWVAGQSIEFLTQLDVSTSLSMTGLKSWNFWGASLVGWGWLLQNTVPRLFARILSATAVVYALIQLIFILYKYY